MMSALVPSLPPGSSIGDTGASAGKRAGIPPPAPPHSGAAFQRLLQNHQQEVGGAAIVAAAAADAPTTSTKIDGQRSFSIPVKIRERWLSGRWRTKRYITLVPGNRVDVLMEQLNGLDVGGSTLS